MDRDSTVTNANNWAWYLGHHYGYRREVGEPQITLNYSRALVDFANHFIFGRGVNFRTPPETEAITPALLRRVWEVDNHKMALLLELGQLGGVSGDVFMKVAFQEPWVDPIGRMHEGKVRLIPLNPAHCVTPDHEILTRAGWKTWDQLTVGEEVRTFNTGEERWEPLQKVNVLLWDGPVSEWAHPRLNAVSTPDHRWITEDGEATTAQIEAQPTWLQIGGELLHSKELTITHRHHRGIVWCPTTPSGTWFCRRKEVMQNGSSGRSVCFMTGNCFP